MALAALKIKLERRIDDHDDATSFAQLSTTCACGAPSAVYFFDPFRAFCSEHAPSQPDRA